MTLKRKLLAALLAGSIAASSVPTMTFTASAATYNEKDLVYKSDPTLFYLGGTVKNQKVLSIIAKAAGKDLEKITFGDLEEITVLDLSDLGIKGVPQIIEYMPRLRVLDLSDNNLTSEAVQSLDLRKCYALRSVDISGNYLTSVPSWYVGLDIDEKDISDNIIGIEDQRSVVLPNPTYYFMLGEPVNVNAFKDKVLSALELSDETALPKFFYDPSLPTYDIPVGSVNDPSYSKNREVMVDIDLSGFIGEDGTVIKTGSVTGTAGLALAYENYNAVTSFKVYFLDGNDATSVKAKLESMIAENEAFVQSEYTAGSWNKFDAALKSAKAVIAYEAADAIMLRNALNSLQTATNALVKGVSEATKKLLNELITISQSFNEEEYSTESWSDLANAVSAMQAAANDAETSILDANAAIRSYQTAQANLAPTLRIKPDIIPKSAFDAIYGEDEDVTASGITRDGKEYSWIFNGKNVTTPADFDPEITRSSEYEDAIRFEVGSASDYQLISFACKTEFPGTAAVTVDVSDSYTKGIYYLYRWDATANKSQLVKKVSVKGGKTSFTIDRGGDYFISSVIQNFELQSEKLEVNHEKLTIVCDFKENYTVAKLRNSLKYGKYTDISDKDGKMVADSSFVATGMTVSSDGDTLYNVVVLGDGDGDGLMTVLDAVLILSAIAEYVTLDSYHTKVALDVNKDGWIRVDDALEILIRASKG